MNNDVTITAFYPSSAPTRKAFDDFLIQREPHSPHSAPKNQKRLNLCMERKNHSTSKYNQSKIKKKIQIAPSPSFSPECDADPMKVFLKNPSVQITDKEKGLIDEINSIKEATTQILKERERFQLDYKIWLQERKKMISQATKEMLILGNPDVCLTKGHPNLIFSVN